MSEKLVLVRNDGPICRITLNRPTRHNAMNRGMLEELDVAIAEANAAPDIRVIVINGAGPSFSSGHDMKESSEDPEIAKLRSTTEGRLEFELKVYYEYSLNVRNSRKPTIAQIHGNCYAAGLMLVAMCDLAIAADDSKFGVPVLHMGLASGEMAYEIWEVGARRAKELLFTGDTLDAKRAAEWGLVNRIVPLAELESTVTELANKIADKPPVGISLMKASINHTLDAMGQSNSFWQHFMTHLLSHSTEEAMANSRRRRDVGKEAWVVKS